MKTLRVALLLLIPFITQAQFTYHHGLGLGCAGTDAGNAIAVDQSGNVYEAGTFETYLDRVHTKLSHQAAFFKGALINCTTLFQ